MKVRPIFTESAEHTTYINKDGIIVPSVTTILKIVNKESLIYWANSLGYRRKSVKDELELSSYVGSTVHKLIEEYTSTGIIDMDAVNKSTLAERILIKNAFKSFLQFYIKEQNDFKHVMMETQLSGKRFGGTLDLLTNFHKKLTLTDYKTSKDFYITMILQAAGYDILLRELHKIKVDQYMIVLLDKKEGKPAKVKIIDNKDEMKLYRKCFKELVLFYYDFNLLEQDYWR